MSKDLSHYPHTEHFRVIDTIGVPHPYCIGPQHVRYCADNFGGIMTKAAIEAFEKSRKKGCCLTPGCTLTYAEHEQAVVVEVHVDSDEESMRKYLLSIADQVKRDGFAGFVLVRKEIKEVSNG